MTTITLDRIAPDGYPQSADKIFRDTYPPIPFTATRFQHGYGWATPAYVHEWQWSVTFGCWTALVTFADGWKGFTYPRLTGNKPSHPHTVAPPTSHFMKHAWIRNGDVPAGQPAPGRIDCPCGQTPESNYSPQNGDVHCPCGTLFTWDGWIKAKRAANGGVNPAEPTL